MKKTVIMAAAVMALAAAAAVAAPKDIAKVNGKAVSADQLTKRLWWQHASQGLSDLVDEQLLLEEAARLGVKADETEVEARITALRSNFANPADFEKNLKSVNWTLADLKTLLRNQILMRNTVMTAAKIAVTDDLARTFYATNKERFLTQESVNLQQIFVNTKADADEVMTAISAGGDFSTIARLKSSDDNLKRNGGNLGYIAKGMLQPELEKEVFALKPGQNTKPIATGAGFSILKVTEFRPAQTIAYEAAQDDIKAALVNQAISQEMPRLLAELRAKAKIEVTK